MPGRAAGGGGRGERGAGGRRGACRSWQHRGSPARRPDGGDPRRDPGRDAGPRRLARARDPSIADPAGFRGLLQSQSGQFRGRPVFPEGRRVLVESVGRNWVAGPARRAGRPPRGPRSAADVASHCPSRSRRWASALSRPGGVSARPRPSGPGRPRRRPSPIRHAPQPSTTVSVASEANGSRTAQTSA